MNQWMHKTKSTYYYFLIEFFIVSQLLVERCFFQINRPRSNSRSLWLGQLCQIIEAVESAVVSCECCGLEEECTGEYIGSVRDYFGGRSLCGLCSESVKYEAGRSKRTPAAAPVGVEEAVRAHMAFCRTLRRGGPAERVAEGMCQMLRRTSSGKPRAVSTSSSSRRPVAATSAPLSIGL